jgi:hypothetical protein
VTANGWFMTRSSWPGIARIPTGTCLALGSAKRGKRPNALWSTVHQQVKETDEMEDSEDDTRPARVVDAHGNLIAWFGTRAEAEQWVARELPPTSTAADWEAVRQNG